MLYVYHPYPTRALGQLSEEIAVYDELHIAHGVALSEIPPGSTVIPRYRMLPFARELEHEVRLLGSALINSYRQHRAIANLYNWVHLLEGITPPAYRLDELSRLPEGEYFLKGETNSKKNNWLESAYAPTKTDAVRIARNLLNDQYVGSQELVIRPFQRYRRIGEAVNGQPIFHERRAFYLDGVLLSEGPYWSVEEYGSPAPKDPEAYNNTQRLAVSAVAQLARFLVIDYAEYEDGSWGVVELNDGAMSGLSSNDPLKLWGAIQRNSERKQLHD